MKLFTYITMAALALSAISASAWNGRRGGPGVMNRGYGFAPTTRPFVGRPNWGGHRPPQFHRPPIFRPHPRPPVIVDPGYPGYPPPVLPPPIEVPVYPVPNPIPDPIEELSYYRYFPQEVFVNEACDPAQYAVPVVNTYPAQTIYCPRTHWNQCAQVGSQMGIQPVEFPYVVRVSNCSVRPTNRPDVLVLIRNNKAWYVGPAEQVGYLYNQYRGMGLCY